MKFYLYNYSLEKWREVGFFKMVWWLIKGRSKARIEIES